MPAMIPKRDELEAFLDFVAGGYSLSDAAELTGAHFLSDAWLGEGAVWRVVMGSAPFAGAVLVAQAEAGRRLTSTIVGDVGEHVAHELGDRADGWLTVTAAGKVMGMGRRTVQAMARRGELEAKRTPGGHWRVKVPAA